MNTGQKENIYRALWTLVYFCLGQEKKRSLKIPETSFFYSGIRVPKGNYRFAGFVTLQVALE